MITLPATPALPPAQGLINAFQNRSATVAVVGLGYVGLPLAAELARAGFRTRGFDVSQSRVAAIGAGTSPILDLSDDALRTLLSDFDFRAGDDPRVLSEADAILVCVPTPLSGTKEPDLSYILEAVKRISEQRRPGQLIVLESTTYPGTTDTLIAEMLMSSGARLDEDTFLAFSPERVDPGNATFTTRTIPKVVGGISPLSTEVALALYQQVLEHVHPVSNARVAETAKLLENTFRAVNIAMVNEFAQLCHELHIDVWEVIAAAKTKPFGFMAFYPGPGVGGHCIPLDPHYLAWSARLSGFEPRFIHIADQVNSTMPRYIVSRVAELLNEEGRAVRGSKLLVFGVAYKRDVNDARESPALEVMHLLEAKGAELRYLDPFVPTAAFKARRWNASQLSPELLAWSDAALILTNHSAFDWPALLPLLRGRVLDTRNAVASASDVAKDKSDTAYDIASDTAKNKVVRL